MTVEDRRQLGVVVERLHPIPDKYGGSYGVILGDDGKPYVWSAGNVYRDMTQMRVGLRVSFQVVAFSYATNISSRGVDQ
jgi:hypothetical protein